MIGFDLSGSFKRSFNFFKNTVKMEKLIHQVCQKYAEQGLKALKESTPVETGLTASKWAYYLKPNGIVYTNDNVKDGYHVVVLLQYGHVTKGGGYVRGIDFINPALRPIFDKISEECWKEVQAL